MLKPLLLLSAAILFVIAPAPPPTLAAGAAPQEPSTNPVKPTAGNQEKAKKLFAQDCSICHGDNGNGKTDLATSMSVTLADWTDPKSLSGMSDQQLFDIIRKGKDKMPAEDPGRAKNDEVWGLVTYIRNLSKASAAAAPAADAAKPGN